MKRLPAPQVEIRRAAIAALESERADSALLSIAFVGRQAMTSLNAKYLRKRRPTDVIAFSFQNPMGGSATVGDIYICPDVARVNARRQRVPVKEEILRLVVHGVLHTLGHDHPESEHRIASKMWKRQEEILASLR